MTRAEFLDKAYAVAEMYEGSITSGRRTRKRNNDVGGHPQSMHIVGLAVDIVFDKSESYDGAIGMCARLGLLALNEGDHLHVQVK